MTNTEYLRRYELLPEGSHVLCALSGGRDSVYLLHRLLEWARQRQLTISAAHFNHRLRGEESDRDERFVRELCDTLHVPLHTADADVAAYAAVHGLGTEEAARTLRYDFLERTRQMIGADVIATAHHANDLAETILFQLARGSGMRGLSGIPPRRGNIVRPLLLTTREEIDAYLQAQGFAYVEDSTNELDGCSRNVIRHRIMPVLQELNPGFVQHAAQSALLLREDDGCLQKQAEDFLTQHPIELGMDGAALQVLDWPIASRVIRTVWGSGLTAEHVQQILDLCSKEGLAYAHVPGAVVRYDCGRLWTQVEATPLPDLELTGEQGSLRRGSMIISWETTPYNQEIHNSLNTFALKYENMEGVVTVTSRRDGDQVKLAGQAHTKRLKQLFQSQKLTQPQRAAVPVFRDEQGIVAVYGFGTAQRCIPEIGDKIICISCKEYRGNGE